MAPASNNYPVPLDELPSNYRPTNCPKLTPPTHGGGRKGYNLFVGTLPATMDKEQLEMLFSPFGSLEDTYLLKQEGKGRWRCGFVSFGQYSSAAHAIARLNGFVIFKGSQPICVRFANPPKSNDAPSPRHGQVQRVDSSSEDMRTDSRSSMGLTPTQTMQSVRSASLDLGQSGAVLQSMGNMLMPMNAMRINSGQGLVLRSDGQLTVAVDDAQLSGIPYSPASSSASIGPDATPTPTPGASADFNLRKQLLSVHAGTTIM